MTDAIDAWLERAEASEAPVRELLENYFPYDIAIIWVLGPDDTFLS